MSKLCSDIPRTHKLKELAQEINNKFELKPTPCGKGIQQSLHDQLTWRLQQLKQKNLLPSSNELRVRLSGDGTNIAKNLHVINFTFTIIEETNCTSTATENHTLAILNVPEKYDSIKEGLADIITEAESLQMINFDSTTYKIEYFLSGDWKFLG